MTSYIIWTVVAYITVHGGEVRMGPRIEPIRKLKRLCRHARLY